MRFILILILVSIYSCKTEPNLQSKPNVEAEPRDLSEAFKEYWYNGEAELTSYDLEYFRYGEKRTGKAMMIFVTEDFLRQQQVKANSKSEATVSVMKLNSTKKFNTGIYPYSIMESTFLPLTKREPLLKASSSIQEWCGQTYAQLNRRVMFELKTHSYFEGEADAEFERPITFTENELWLSLRIDPRKMKLGEQKILPSLSFLQLNHKKFKAYKAIIEQSEGDYIVTSLTYAALGRILNVYQSKSFPYSIEKWEELDISSNDTLVSRAIKNKTLRTKYWEKNSNKYLHLRDSLNL
ncbi:hypothetical protein [Psychroflexus tropicus]|uniref:hypothetical protein n=1 Tax=Psychroflexus tropicus TaxID=197345 RepID=UPI000377DD3E|nr:hypothetical protein [Psychroflexus tropicus]